MERVDVSPALLELRTRLLAVSRDAKVGAVFPNRQGNPYTARGFAAMWGKLMREALAKKVIAKRFTFHDLRAQALDLRQNAVAQAEDQRREDEKRPPGESF